MRPFRQPLTSQRISVSQHFLSLLRLIKGPRRVARKDAGLFVFGNCRPSFSFSYFSFEFVNSTIVKSAPRYPTTAFRVEAAGRIDLLTNRGRIIRKNHHDGLHLICVEINFREETRKHQKKKVLFVTVGSAWEETRGKRGAEG